MLRTRVHDIHHSRAPHQRETTSIVSSDITSAPWLYQREEEECDERHLPCRLDTIVTDTMNTTAATTTTTIAATTMDDHEIGMVSGYHIGEDHRFYPPGTHQPPSTPPAERNSRPGMVGCHLLRTNPTNPQIPSNPKTPAGVVSIDLNRPPAGGWFLQLQSSEPTQPTQKSHPQQ